MTIADLPPALIFLSSLTPQSYHSPSVCLVACSFYAAISEVGLLDLTLFGLTNVLMSTNLPVEESKVQTLLLILICQSYSPPHHLTLKAYSLSSNYSGPKL